MPLPSSGEIKLSQIRDEFGLTAGQIAMSSLYSKGNAPASGEIQIGADFHGTAGVTYLINGTLTAGQVTDKTDYVMVGYDPSTPGTNSSIGSVSLSTNTGSLSHMVDTIDNSTTGTPRTFHTYMTNAAARADTHKIIVGNTTLNRRSLHMTVQNLQHINASITGWERYVSGGISNPTSSNIGFSSGTTYNIQVVKMGDDETWLDTTMTVGHWTNTDIKSATVSHRGFSGNGTGTIGHSTFNSGGSISSNVLTNPDTGQASGYTLNNIFGNTSTPNAIATSSIGITGTDNQLQANRFRGVLLTKTGGSQLWMSFASGNSSSTVIPSGATVVTPDQATTTVIRDRDGTDIYNFLSTSGEQINVKVY